MHHDDAEFHTASSVSIGRHSDIVGESICTRAVKKELLVRTDVPDASLYVRTECDGCGEIEVVELTGESVLG